MRARLATSQCVQGVKQMAIDAPRLPPRALRPSTAAQSSIAPTSLATCHATTNERRLATAGRMRETQRASLRRLRRANTRVSPERYELGAQPPGGREERD